MGMILTVNHRPETVLTPHDFEDLIDKYMGSESADLFREYVKELCQTIEGLTRMEVKDDYGWLDEAGEVLQKYGY